MRLITKKAFTYLEILAGIAIISFILFGMNTIFGIGIKNNRKSIKVTQALGLAQEKMEEIKAKQFSDIGLGTTTDTIDNFMRKVTVTYINEDDFNEESSEITNAKRVTVTVSESDIRGVELSCVTSNPNLE